MHDFEGALDGAILAVAAVQRDEGAVVALQVVQRLGGRIEGMDIDALPLQRGQYARTAIEGNLALGGGTAEEDCDFTEIRHARLQNPPQRRQGAKISQRTP